MSMPDGVQASGRFVELNPVTPSGLPAADVEVRACSWHHYLPRLGQAAEGTTPDDDRGPA